MIESLARIRRAADRLSRPIVVRASYTLRREPPHDSLVDAATSHPVPPEATIVVLGGRAPSLLAAALRTAHPGAAVHDLDQTARTRLARLAALGPIDLIVDDGPRWGAAHRLLDTFYALRAGGALIIGRASTDVRHGRGALGRLLAEASPRGDAAHLHDALGATVLDRHHTTLTSRLDPALAKLTEPEIDAYLGFGDGRSGTTTRVFDSNVARSGCRVRENTLIRSRNQPRVIRAIEVRLRDFRDVIVGTRQVVTDGRVLTPDTFRHNQAHRLVNRTLSDVAPRFARRSDLTGALPAIDGTYFHLDSEFRGHFGHLITEQVSRFWAWPLIKDLDPDAKAVVTTRKGHTSLHGWELAVYAAGGIAAEDIVLLDTPVRVQRLLAGTPLYCHPQYVHPQMRGAWRSVGDRLIERAGTAPLPTRIFCTRRPGRRSCRNAGEVEEIFAAAGFSVIRPETYSIQDQAKVFRDAEVVAGFAGSGMFGICFALRPKPVIVIRSAAYAGRNEYLISSLLGHDLTAIVCRPDDPGDYHSAYSFDHAREGRYLDRVLERLSGTGVLAPDAAP